MHVPEGIDAKAHLKTVYDAEIARLIAHRDGNLHAIDETEREQAMLGNLPDDPILKTYKSGEIRHLNAALKIIKTMEVSLGQVGLAPKLSFPRKMMGETRDEFNQRVDEYRGKTREAEWRERELSNAKRLREIEEAREAERTAHPGFDPCMTIEEYIKKVREWHERVFGENYPMDAPASLRAKLADALPKNETPVERQQQPEQADTSTPKPPARKPASQPRNRKKE